MHVDVCRSFISNMLNAAASSSNNGRPAIPERSAEDDYEDPPTPPRDEEGDEAPQIVVLKEGKHLSKEEVEQRRPSA